jgi:hypothetical protein
LTIINMTEHLTEQQMESFRQRKMSPEGLLTAHQHIAVCESCRAQLSASIQVEVASAAFERELQQADAEDEHLLYQQLSGYVDDELHDIDREIVESHLETCVECAAEVRDLLAFKSTIAAKENETFETPLQSQQSLSWWNGWTLWNPIRAAAAAAGIILILTAIFLLWTKVSHQNQTQVAQSPQVNGVVTPPNPPVFPSPSASPQRKPEGDFQKSTDNNRERPSPIIEKQPGSIKVEGEPTPPSRIIVALTDGETRITLDSHGRISGVAARAPGVQRLLSEALASQRLLKPPVLNPLIRESSMQLGVSEESFSIALLQPVGTVVESDRPTFSWGQLNGASGYTVSVFDAQLNEVERSRMLTKTVWNPSRRLQRGATYRWQVIAVKDGREIVLPLPTAPEAKFKVLEQQQAQALARERQRYANSHLALGLLYAQRGLLDEAETELQALVKENPDSTVAKKLLQSLQAWRPAQHTPRPDNEDGLR